MCTEMAVAVNDPVKPQSVFVPQPADGVTAELLRSLLMNPRIPSTARLATVPARAGTGPMIGFTWSVLGGVL